MFGHALAYPGNTEYDSLCNYYKHNMIQIGYVETCERNLYKEFVSN